MRLRKQDSEEDRLWAKGIGSVMCCSRMDLHGLGTARWTSLVLKFDF